MHIKDYQEGRQIKLVADPTNLPQRNRLVILISYAFLSIFLMTPWIFLPRHVVAIGFGVIWSLVILGIMRLIWKQMAPPPSWSSIHFTQTGTSHCELRSPDLQLTRKSFQVADVKSISLSLFSADSAQSEVNSGSTAEDLKLNLELSFADQEILQGYCVISRVNLRAELIDFGTRLSDILGIEWGQIVENTPLTFLMTFTRELSPKDSKHLIDVCAERSREGLEVDDSSGWELIGSSTNASNELEVLYQQDQLEDLRLDQVITEAWDPKKHTFQPEVISYEPSQELTYELRVTSHQLIMRTLTFAFIFAFVGSSFFNLAFQYAFLISVLGFGAYYWKRWQHGDYIPTHFAISWTDLTCTQTRGKEQQIFDLTQATTLELVRVKTKRTSGTGKSRRTYYTYNCITSLRGLPDVDVLKLAETGELSEDPERVYQSGVAFAALFSEALGLKLKFEERGHS